MTTLAKASRQFVAGIVVSVLTTATAFAATYQIGLFQGATGTGSGSLTYSNPGNAVRSDPVTVSNLATNGSSAIGVQTFTSGTLNVQVAQVNFNDGKTPPNQITGFYVEGLTGTLQTAAATGLTATGQCQIQACFYRITFSFAANPNPNTAGVKTYVIQRIRASNGNVDATVVPNGTYGVTDTATIPEPGTAALIGIGLAALALRLRRRRAIA